MNKAVNQNNSLFFILVVILTLPSYILVGIASNDVILNKESAIGFVLLSALAPLVTAVILILRVNKKQGLKTLFKRTFDFRLITKKIWYITVFLLIPLIFLVVYAILQFSGNTLAGPQFPLYTIPVQFVMFFIMAAAEELGWMGFAWKNLEVKAGTKKSILFLSVFWALWHVPFYFFIMDSLWTVLILPFCLIALRLIMIWVFKHTNNSIFAVIIMHTTYNLSIGILPVYNIVEGQVLTCVLLLLTALLILFSGGLKKFQR